MPAATTFATWFTTAGGTKEMLSTNMEWKQVTLRLETAGPVVVGEQQGLQPLASGKGRFLPQGVEVIVTLPPLSKLYIASDTVNRVAVSLAPFPYLAAILTGIVGPAAAAAAGAGNPVQIGGFGFKDPTQVGAPPKKTS